MPEDRLPLLRGRAYRTDYYRSPKAGQSRKVPLPPRDPLEQRQRILNQLDALASAAAGRPAEARVARAAREIVAVRPELGCDLPATSLGEKRGDVRVISQDEDTRVVLLDAPAPDLPQLRRKTAAYADATKVNKKTNLPRNAPLIAPIQQVQLAEEADLAGPRFRAAMPQANVPLWFEVSCRGGTRRPPSDTESSRAQIAEALTRLGHAVPQSFVATERLFVFVRLSASELRTLIASVDCVFEFDVASPDIRDWLLLEKQPAAALRDFQLTPPPEDAPSVVLLDTGVVSRHPLLDAALLSRDSAIPGEDSPEDMYGHGTKMAGVSLYDDVGAVVEAGVASASHWLQNVRTLIAPGYGSASEENRQFWPAITQAAVLKAEAHGRRPRAFAMAVTAPLDDPPHATMWSHAIDQLAYSEGDGRLICVSIGNAPLDLGLVQDYPLLNLSQKVEDPAQAANALTVGACTTKVSLPPDPAYANTRVVAPAGGVSPHTRSNVVGAAGGAVKPDIVLEGGNIGFDGHLPDAAVETLVTLTAARDFTRTPLATMHGTSCATAVASRMAAQVWLTDPSLRPETVRGLLVHSARWTRAMEQQFTKLDERLAICGYGVPNLEYARACARERATIIFEDTIPNAVVVQEPKKKPPRRARAKTWDEKLKRLAKLFAVPIPDNLLAGDTQADVELHVTLSYFAEPNTFRRRVERGLDLAWDMQGPAESEDVFLKRINGLMRGEGQQEQKTGQSFHWSVGKQRRSRGTVQSDRWRGPASYLAGPKLIAVYPVLGWWDQRDHLRTAEMAFSLIVTVEAPGIDVYTAIAAALQLPVQVSAR